jgi:CYTH domain-containing protein
MDELELERTFLAKELPKEIEGADFVEIVDTYIPDGPGHAELRLRKKGDKYAITKKTPMTDDGSEMMEHTIVLNKAEYEALYGCSKKRVVKKRYFAKIEGHDAEVDVFLEDLAGLVLVDFEFSDVEEKNKFKMPKSLLADVTPEEFIAGGMLAGKKYEEIEGKLKEFGYKRIKEKA